MAEDRPSQEPRTAGEVDLTASEPSPDSIEAVTREAESLLNGPDAGSDDVQSTEDLVADVERTLDLVDALVEDADLIASTPDTEASTAETSDVEPDDLDLTVTLPETPVEPDDQVPDHGTEGPSVDLFAQPEPDPESKETPSANPRLIFEEDRRSGPTPETRSDSLPQEDALLQAMTDEFGSTPSELPAVAESEKTLETPTVGRRSRRDAAASRLQDLLTARLAEEYDSVEDVGGRDPSVEESIGEEATTDPVVIESAGEEESLDPRIEQPLPRPDDAATPVLPDASEFDLEERSAVEQEATLEFIETAPSASASKVVKDEIPPVSDPATSSDASASTLEEAPDLPVDPAPSNTGEDAEASSTVESGSENVGVVEETADAPAPEPVSSPSVTESEVRPQARPEDQSGEETEVEATGPAEAASASEPEPEPEPEPEFEAVVEDPDEKAMNQERAPGIFSRLATPLALSLLAWVPLVWGYALMAPAPPDPSAAEVLPVGISDPTVDPAIGPLEPDDSTSTPPSSD